MGPSQWLVAAGMLSVGTWSWFTARDWAVHAIPNGSSDFPAGMAAMSAVVLYLLVLNSVFVWLPAALGDAVHNRQRHQLIAPAIAFVVLILSLYNMLIDKTR